MPGAWLACPVRTLRTGFTAGNDATVLLLSGQVPQASCFPTGAPPAIQVHAAIHFCSNAEHKWEIETMGTD